MKRLLAAIAVVAFFATAYFITRKETDPRVVQPAAPPHGDAPTATNTEPVEVFKRAFWRPPTPDDKILHAERREWSDLDGVKKWQWFLAVEPSPELLKYVRDDNAFGLSPVSAKLDGVDAPAWFSFKPGEVEALGSPRGNLRLIFSKTGNTLHATDFGGGFHRGAREPFRPTKSGPVSSGRLPHAPPPTSPQED